ncbi:MAG: MarR family transcriptional regulator [Burkholderiaceae bacterium]
MRRSSSRLRLLTCTNLIQGQIRQRLRLRFDSTLPRFDLLAQLARSEHGLRMSELSQRLMVTGGNVTALTEQLQNEDMLRREAHARDRRVTHVNLTAPGRERFAAMAAEHEAWVVSLCSNLSRHEQRQLFELLGKLKHGIQQAGQAHGPGALPSSTPAESK